MKYIFIFSILILSASCKKCYQCTDTVVDAQTGETKTNKSYQPEFCGTKKAKQQYERDNSDATVTKNCN